MPPQPNRSRFVMSAALIMLGLLAIFGLALFPSAAQDATPLPTITPRALPPTQTPLPRPFPWDIIQSGNVTIETFSESLAQGQVGLIRVSGAGLAGARARFINELRECFAVEGDGFFCIIAPGMEQAARTYDLDIFTWFEDGTRTTVTTPIRVDIGAFIRQDVTLAPDKTYLLDPEVERAEIARLESIFGGETAEKMWDNTGFQMPIPGGELTSPYGAFRSFNESLQTRHTGWDIRATLGTPVMATAAGEVVFTGLLEIRGSIVIIDHGYGVYSTYCHLSQTHVTRGQSISKGQIIGTVGNNGRTSGPHFHWEVAVNGEFMDASRFISTWLP